MLKLKAVSAVAVLTIALSGCGGYVPSFGAWSITSVNLVEGLEFEDPPPCTDVVGFGLVTWGAVTDHPPEG